MARSVSQFFGVARYGAYGLGALTLAAAEVFLARQLPAFAAQLGLLALDALGVELPPKVFQFLNQVLA